MKHVVIIAFLLNIVMGSPRNYGGYKGRFGLPLETDPASPGIPNDFSGDEVFMWKNGRSLWQHNRISFDDRRPPFVEGQPHSYSTTYRPRPTPGFPPTRTVQPPLATNTPSPTRQTTKPTTNVLTQASRLPSMPTKKVPVTTANPKTTTKPRQNKPPTTKTSGGQRNPKKSSQTTNDYSD